LLPRYYIQGANKATATNYIAPFDSVPKTGGTDQAPVPISPPSLEKKSLDRRRPHSLHTRVSKRRDGRCHSRKREGPKPLGRRKSRSGGAPALLPPRRRPPRDPESREPRAGRGPWAGGVSRPDLRRKRPALRRGGARGGRSRRRTGAPSSSALEIGDCGDLTATELYSVSVCRVTCVWIRWWWRCVGSVCANLVCI
jgi:hypothetical protein